MKDVEIRSVEPGAEARICTGWVEVIRHGDLGTTVRSLTRIERTVHSKRTGETKTFSAPAEAYAISSSSPVYEARPGSNQ